MERDRRHCSWVPCRQIKPTHRDSIHGKGGRMRKDCPKSAKMGEGCIHWVGKDKGSPMGCSKDTVKFDEGYGPFYENTRCCRLGSACYPDEFKMVTDAKEVVEAMNLGIM